jgi:hypothetical protein
MGLGILLVLAAIMIVLLRRTVLRDRRQRRGLPVSGPWRFPSWLKPQLSRLLRRWTRPNR